MTSVSGRQLTRLLERNGWVLLRVHGSHHIYGKPGVAVRISVPMHEGRVMKTGLLRHILKTAGLDEQDL